MADHTLEVQFKMTSGCSTINTDRDHRIIMRMAHAICVPGTSVLAIPPEAINEAIRVYILVNAMRLALEDEIREQVAREAMN